MKYLMLSVSFLFFWTLLQAQKETNLLCNVRPVTSNVMVDGYQLIYSLPKNYIEVSLHVNHFVQIPGPYAKYAEKFLNITEGIILTDAAYYEIQEANFRRLSRPDSLMQYVISYEGFGTFPALQLTPDGLIKACNVSREVVWEQVAEAYQIPLVQEPEAPFFTDLGVIPFVEEKSETLYKMVPTDSTPRRVPYDNTKVVPTSEENNAKEAADFIRKLRKRRLKLLIGLKDETFPVEGEAMKVMVAELENLERKYLELFVGKTVQQTLTYKFNFEPEADVQAEQQIVGWFSLNNGFSAVKPDLRKTDYKPLTIHATRMGSIPEVSIQQMNNSGKSPVAIRHGLFYRIPAWVNLSLSFTDKVLLSQKMLIAQRGTVAPLPADYLNQGIYEIEFYPDLGSIKRIQKKSRE
jgi:hypothetical protein